MAGVEKPEYWFDEEAADRAVTFFPRFLRHVKGEWAGQPFELSEWQREQIIRPVFGWKRKDGTRRYRTVYVEVPRKSGKSTRTSSSTLESAAWTAPESCRWATMPRSSTSSATRLG